MQSSEVSPDSGPPPEDDMRFRQATANALAVAAAVLALAAGAQAEIIVSPLRQVITATEPTAVYQISNPSSRIVDGRVSWVDLIATETGYAPASPQDRARLSAAPYLVVEPAAFRLEPGGRTTIKVRLKKKGAPPAGEHRSHLMIETDAARTPIRKAGGGLEVDIGLGLSTPVIVRGAGAAPKIAFGLTRLLRDGEGLLELETELERVGNYSAFGRLTAEMKSGRERITVAVLENIAVYSDAKKRKVSLPLNVEMLPPGVLTVRYEGAGEYKGRIFAEKTFEISSPK
jgi:P pilus assembly chaperone PapD